MPKLVLYRYCVYTPGITCEGMEEKEDKNRRKGFSQNFLAADV